MSQTQNSQRSGNRSSGRRRNNNNRRPSSQGPYSQRQTTKAPAKKKSLAQKVLGFFGLGKKDTPAPRPTRPVDAAPTGKVTRESIPGQGGRGQSRQGQDGARQGASRNGQGARKPELVEVTNPRLYIGNLSYDATEGDLQEVFNGVGRVSSVEIVTNSRTQRSKGYGFVEMGSIEEAKRAVDTLHDKEFMGRKLVVSGAKPKDESSPDT